MELRLALDLKTELRLRLPDRDRSRGDSPLGAIAVGVAPREGLTDYCIAVRARSQDDLSDDVMRVLSNQLANEISLRITGPIAASSLLQIGASTGHRRGATGTIGFFARRDSDGSVGFVSNNHVLAGEDEGRENDAILHPGRGDKGQWPKDIVAVLAGDYPPLRRDPQTVDCAFARLVRGIDFDPALVSASERLSPITAVPSEAVEVSKVGRTSGRTFGRVTAFAMDNVDVDYSFGPLRFNGQIEIEPLDTTPFSRPGDSGSLVFTHDLHPLGLTFACSAAGGRLGCGLTYANPIGSVLRALGVTLLT
jgi:hypothetical protein